MIMKTNHAFEMGNNLINGNNAELHAESQSK